MVIIYWRRRISQLVLVPFSFEFLRRQKLKVLFFNKVYIILFGSPQVGLEPTTNRLTADCSTTELLRQ